MLKKSGGTSWFLRSKLKMRCSFLGGIHSLVLLEEAYLLTKDQCWLWYPQTFQIFGFQCKSHCIWCTKPLISWSWFLLWQFQLFIRRTSTLWIYGEQNLLNVSQVPPHSQKLNCKWRKPKMLTWEEGFENVAGIWTSPGFDSWSVGCAKASNSLSFPWLAPKCCRLPLKRSWFLIWKHLPLLIFCFVGRCWDVP